MLEIGSSLDAIRDLAESPETADLTRLLLNSTSTAEATLALQILEQNAPPKRLAVACNLREVLAELPVTPCAMAVDADTLQRVGGFEKRPLGVLARTLEDGWEIDVLCAGNLVLDIVIRRDGRSDYLVPVPRDRDFVTEGALEAILTGRGVLDAVLDTVQAMGLVFNPRFYLSLDDYRMEHAARAVESLGDLF